MLDHVTDALGHTVATYTHDAMGRVLTVRDGDGITTRFEYDGLGRLKRVYDPRLTGSVNVQNSRSWPSIALTSALFTLTARDFHHGSKVSPRYDCQNVHQTDAAAELISIR